MRKAVFLAAAIGLACLATAAPAQTRAAPSGVWTGYFGYEGTASTVQFQARFTASGAAFSGATIEPNTFGDPGVLFLTANISGAADAAGRVSFVKTYDGTGGQSHSVRYAGAYEPSGACISGTWTIDATAGPFKMCAVGKPNS
jgi:hypothetical protein